MRTPSSVGPGGTVPLHRQVRAAVVTPVHLRVAPVQPDRGAERLGQRLLGGEARGERGRRQLLLGVGEQPLGSRGVRSAYG